MRKKYIEPSFLQNKKKLNNVMTQCEVSRGQAVGRYGWNVAYDDHTSQSGDCPGFHWPTLKATLQASSAIGWLIWLASWRLGLECAWPEG